jgi:hypothetical protein
MCGVHSKGISGTRRKKPTAVASNGCKEWFARQYRLRVGEVRVFYDVSGAKVEILAIVAKSDAHLWLAQFGNPE